METDVLCSILQVWLGSWLLLPEGHACTERKGTADGSRGKQPSRDDDREGAMLSIESLPIKAHGIHYKGGKHATEG